MRGIGAARPASYSRTGNLPTQALEAGVFYIIGLYSGNGPRHPSAARPVVTQGIGAHVRIAVFRSRPSAIEA